MAGLEPQLVDEVPTPLLVGVERVGLAACAVEGEHELLAQALVKGMRGDEPLELGHQVVVAPELEVRVDAVLERRQRTWSGRASSPANSSYRKSASGSPRNSASALCKACARTAGSCAPRAALSSASKRARSLSPGATASR